ncbi:MAG: ribosomal protein S18-alanine N-acetyltransferase [Desulfurococcales archaeon]|nr:ribosomal protein S18-alanine N-acetyltransferase [Desulfurococcales archaeon]
MSGPSQGWFRVRQAREEDIPQVMEVNYKSLPENYWYGFFKFILDNWPKAFLVAEAEGRVIGYAMSRVESVSDPVLRGLENELEGGAPEARPAGGGIRDRLRGLFSRRASPGRVGHLVSIAVLEEYRGRGVGSALLSETIRSLRDHYGVESIYLEVRVSNERAIRLYEKFGFRKVRIIKKYYMDGEDAYVMVLRFGQSDATS